MGFFFGLIGALAGAWISAGGDIFFGFLVGMTLGWSVHRLVLAESTIRKLNDRMDLLEQRNAAVARTKPRTESPAKKTFESPPRVSPYEPTPTVSTPAPAPVPPPILGKKLSMMPSDRLENSVR